MNFLIIEDEILIQKSIRKILEFHGHQVDSTVSGLQALEFLKTNSYHRVICDLMLKYITGFEIIEEYKNLFGSESIKNKIIIITAYSTDQILNLAAPYGCTLVKKPFHDLKKTIEFFIHKSE
jgi:CheY-like chemotaxis protein